MNKHRPQYADPTPDEIWGIGGLAEQQRELRETLKERRRKHDPCKEESRGIGRIRVCKTHGKLREAIE